MRKTPGVNLWPPHPHVHTHTQNGNNFATLFSFLGIALYGDGYAMKAAYEYLGEEQ